MQGDFRFAGVAGLGLEAGQFIQAGGGAAVVRVVVHHGLELLAGFVQLRAFLVGVDLAQPEVGVGPELPLGEVLQVILEGGGRGVEIALEQLAAGGGIGLAVRFRVGGRVAVAAVVAGFGVGLGGAVHLFDQRVNPGVQVQVAFPLRAFELVQLMAKLFHLTL